MPHPMSRLTVGLPRKLTQVVALLCFAFAGYFTFTFSGPYRSLAELQMGLIGEYYPTLTWMLAGLLMMVPLLAAFQLARRLGVLAGTDTTIEQHDEMIRSENARWAKNKPALMLLTIGVVATSIGARDWLTARSGRTLERVGVAALERGVKPTGTWLEASGGMANWNAAVELQEDASVTTFVPVTSSEWRQQQSIALVIRLDSFDMRQLGPEARVFLGAHDLTGLPGAVNAAFSNAKLDTSRALLLDFGENPAENEMQSAVVAGIGFASLVAAVLLMVNRRRLHQL